MNLAQTVADHPLQDALIGLLTIAVGLITLLIRKKVNK